MSSPPYIFSSDGLNQPSLDGLEQPRKRQLIVTLAAQTGDQAHVAAAAALDDRTDVLVIFSLEKTKSPEARQASVKYFQGATGTTDTTTPKRVHQICLESHVDSIKLYNTLVDGNGWRRDMKWIAPLEQGQTGTSKIRRQKADLEKMKDTQV